MSISIQDVIDLFNYLNDGVLPEGLNRWQLQRFRAKASHFELQVDERGNRYLAKEGKEVVPNDLEEVNKKLSEMYFNPLTGFVGRDKFWEKVKEKYYGITYEMVEQYLKRNSTAQIHRKPPERIVVQPIISKRPYERLQVDLIDLSQLQLQNQGYRYVLNVVDHFSKFAWSFPLKFREMNVIVQHLESIFRVQAPQILQGDNEFGKKEVKALCERYNVKLILSMPYHPQSNGGVERFNQTLKGMLFKFMDSQNTKEWLQVLSLVVENYNNTYHSTIKMKPIEALEPQQRLRAAKNLITRAISMESVPPEYLKRGQKVRLRLTALPANRRMRGKEKKYMANYTKEIYVVAGTPRSVNPKYLIKDLQGGIVGRFFGYDLLPIPDQVIEGEQVEVPIRYREQEEIPVVQVDERPIAVRRTRRDIRAPTKTLGI